MEKSTSWYADFQVDRPPCPPRPKTHFEPQIPIDADQILEDTYDLSVNEALTRVAADLSKTEAKRWAWDASDELAIRNGCRFDLRRAMHVALCWRNNLLLWEGRWAGEPFMMRTWQWECFLRIFGWVRPHDSLGWVRRFSKAAVWVPKKSGKSPSGAAVAIYLWHFDGPWIDGSPKRDGGSHVYCVAKNGKQAGIVWNHAANMVQHSPTLKPLCETKEIRTNQVRSLLRNEETLSHLTIVTGDSPAARAAAHGLNAKALIIDEAHIVDATTMDILRDCGASQEEHLSFQISTAGNTDGYGRKEWDRGFDLQAGKLQDDGFFFKSYNAPRDIADDDCATESVWYDANPNLGFTVSTRQFQQAYQRAKDDPVEFSNWKNLRLNIWQRSSNPMINHFAWKRCAEPGLSYDSLKGVGGGVAFDLAVTNDFASVAVAWDESEKLNCWAKIWTCEKWIEDNGWRGDFEQWAKDCHLTVCEGAAIDIDEEVPGFIEKLIRHTKAAALGYDIKFGEATAQRLLKRFPRLKQGKFNQSLASYSVGTHEFRNAVKNGTLRHPDNACLNWMAGHVMAKAMGVFLKPVKPQSDGNDIEWAKVDAIQAICMAITAKTLHPSSPQTDSVASYEVSDDDMKSMDEFWNDIDS